MATVRESVQEELVYIGTADKHLRFAIGKGIKQPEYFYSGAQKAAIEYGLRLEVSWAVTPTPDVHKASLVLAYEQEHDARPGFRRPDTGEWTPGVRLLVRKHGEAYGDLTWSAWMPMRTSTISHIPEELGVYRVRAVLRVAADVEETPAHPEVVHATEELTRRSLEDFVTEVPAWRARYLEGNGCIFKVEAFVRRDWENTSLQRSLCEEKLPWVENRIAELTGKEDMERLEDDIEVVYHWGGGFGPMLFNQIINDEANPIEKIRSQARLAFEALAEGRPAAALEHLKTLRHCGDSFGTKVLAMRSPKDAPIWDEIAKACLSDFRMGGKRVRSYARFIRFCEEIAKRLEERGQENPRGTRGRWYLRDIEMAIFQFGWEHDKFKGRITGRLP